MRKGLIHTCACAREDGGAGSKGERTAMGANGRSFGTIAFIQHCATEISDCAIVFYRRLCAAAGDASRVLHYDIVVVLLL